MQNNLELFDMKKILYTICALGLIVSSCTKDNEIDFIGADNTISFFASDISSRVIDNGTTLSWELNDEISILANSSTDYLLSVHKITDISSGELTYSSGEQYYTDKYALWNFYAWYPTSLALSGSNTLSLDVSTSPSTLKQMVYASTLGSATDEVNLTFSPFYTKLTFSLTAGGMDVLDLTGAKATLSGAITEAEFDVESAAFVTTNSTDITLDVDVEADNTTRASVSFYVLETLDMDGSLTISVDGKTFTTNFDSKEWLRGKKYDYNLMVGEIVFLSDFADSGKYATSLPTQTTWVISDVGAPTTAEFAALKQKLLDLGASTQISLVFPYLTAVPDDALRSAKALVSFEAENLVSVGSYAFSECTSLTGSLALPTTLKTIGSNAYAYCSALSGDLVIPDNVTEVGANAFYSCSGFDAELTLSSSLTTIGDYAFSGCTALTGDISLPSGLLTVGYNAFYNCPSFDGALTIPTSVTKIGSTAFYGCNALTSIEVLWTSSIPSVDQYTFPIGYRTTGSSSISIPSGMSTTYTAVSGWSNYSLSDI